MTFRMHDALAHRYAMAREVRETQLGRVAAFFATNFFGSEKQQWTEEDFMTIPRTPEPEKPPLSPLETLAHIRMMNSLAGGTEVVL